MRTRTKEKQIRHFKCPKCGVVSHQKALWKWNTCPYCGFYRAPK